MIKTELEVITFAAEDVITASGGTVVTPPVVDNTPNTPVCECGPDVPPYNGLHMDPECPLYNMI